MKSLADRTIVRSPTLGLTAISLGFLMITLDAFLEIDELEAPVVREIFDCYVERRESIRQIARALRSSSRYWTRCTAVRFGRDAPPARSASCRISPPGRRSCITR